MDQIHYERHGLIGPDTCCSVDYMRPSLHLSRFFPQPVLGRSTRTRWHLPDRSSDELELKTKSDQLRGQPSRQATWNARKTIFFIFSHCITNFVIALKGENEESDTAEPPGSMKYTFLCYQTGGRDESSPGPSGFNNAGNLKEAEVMPRRPPLVCARIDAISMALPCMSLLRSRSLFHRSLGGNLAVPVVHPPTTNHDASSV